MIISFSVWSKRKNLEYAWIYYIHKIELFIKKSIKPEKLPPTESAAVFHSLRVDCQILKWKNEDQTDFSPTQWEWKNYNGSFEPIDTILEPGPAELLNVIRCN